MRKLTVILLSTAIALLGLTTMSVAKDPQAYWNTPQEYEKVTGNKIEKFYEAPMLRTKVAAGEILPVEKRLPEDPQVIVPIEEIGQYGGTWHMPYADPGMGWQKMVMYDPAVRWNRGYTAYIPGLVKKWEFSNEGKTATFHFRKGLKWSDGHPFTTEDLRFWWIDLATNEEVTKVGLYSAPWWSHNVDGSLMKVQFIDDYTISFTFKEPHWNVPYNIASGFWEWEPLMKPKHYLKQFHPKYNSKMKDYITLEDKDKWWQNPDYPVLFAWRTVEYEPGKRVAFERNPYYWKVDTAGNQLPYIDRIEAKYVADPEVRLLQAIRGEYDATFRGIEDPLSIPLLKEKEKAGDYRVIMWKNGAGAWPGVVVNQTYNVEETKDQFMHDLLRNKYFRQALSYSVDRKRVNDVVWNGMARIQQFTISRDSWHFVSPEGKKVWHEWANSYVEYNPTKANELLDEIGLNKRDSDGFRTRPDGTKLELVLDITDKRFHPKAAVILKKNWEAVGLRIVLNSIYDTPAVTLRGEKSIYQLRLDHIAEMDLWTYPDWVFPTGTDPNRRMWPFIVRYQITSGHEGTPIEKGSVEERLMEIFNKGMSEPDPEKRHHYIWDGVRIHIDEGPFCIGITGGQPIPVVVKNDFRNVSNFGVLGPWAIGGPGDNNPEQFFFKR